MSRPPSLVMCTAILALSPALWVFAAQAGASDTPEEAGKKIIAKLIGELGSDDEGERAQAVKKLEAMVVAGKEALPALIKALADNSPRVRADAAGALGHMGTVAKEAVPALIKSLDDPFVIARSNAAWSLGQIGPVTKEVVPALIKTLDDPDGDPRMYAAQSLGDMGQAAEPGIPALTRVAYKDRCPMTSEAARHALEKLGALPQGYKFTMPKEGIAVAIAVFLVLALFVASRFMQRRKAPHRGS